MHGGCAGALAGVDGDVGVGAAERVVDGYRGRGGGAAVQYGQLEGHLAAAWDDGLVDGLGQVEVGRRRSGPTSVALLFRRCCRRRRSRSRCSRSCGGRGRAPGRRPGSLDRTRRPRAGPSGYRSGSSRHRAARPARRRGDQDRIEPGHTARKRITDRHEGTGGREGADVGHGERERRCAPARNCGACDLAMVRSGASTLVTTCALCRQRRVQALGHELGPRLVDDLAPDRQPAVDRDVETERGAVARQSASRQQAPAVAEAPWPRRKTTCCPAASNSARSSPAASVGLAGALGPDTSRRLRDIRCAHGDQVTRPEILRPSWPLFVTVTV